MRTLSTLTRIALAVALLAMLMLGYQIIRTANEINSCFSSLLNSVNGTPLGFIEIKSKDMTKEQILKLIGDVKAQAHIAFTKYEDQSTILIRKQSVYTSALPYYLAACIALLIFICVIDFLIYLQENARL